MRKLAIAFALAYLLSTVGTSTAQQYSKNNTAQTVSPVRIARTYSVGDLAVWSKDRTRFDASILIALLEAKVTPGQWDGKNSIKPFADKASLVVNTTQEAHEAIANSLAELRKK